MSRRMLGRTVCAVVGLVGTLLLPGCGPEGVDKSGPAVAPQNMDTAKQKQYNDFMNSRGAGGGGGGGAAPGGAPSAPGGAPSAPAGGGAKPAGNVPAMPHG